MTDYVNVHLGHDPSVRRDPFWVRCGKCSYCWALYLVPIEVDVGAKLMSRAQCPKCDAGADHIEIAKQEDGVLLEGRPAPDATADVASRAAAWRTSGDAGLSSRAIWGVMTGVSAPNRDHPRDAADLGRCLRLLDLIPEWKPRLHMMRGLSLYWDALIERWDELAQTMIDECGIKFEKAQSAPRTYALMRSILDPIEDADRHVVRLGGGMTMTFGGRR